MGEKVTLQKEMETLLIPLYGRAKMSDQGIFADTYACQTVNAIDYDFSRLSIPKKLQIFMAIRGNIIEDYTKKFLCDNTQAMVISLGSGLDARYARVSGYKNWIDLDFPQVIELREKLLPNIENHQSIASSVTDWSWIDTVHSTQDNVLVIAEGLLMYLQEKEVEELFGRLISKFPNLTFIFDAYSNLTVKKIAHQSSLRKTGATINWGTDSYVDIEKMNPKLSYEKTLYLTNPKYMSCLNSFYRFMFRFADHFKLARKAHRIFIFHTK